MTPSSARPDPAVPAVRGALSKVPQVTVAFWTISILTAGMGETTSDLLAHSIDPKIAVSACVVGLAAALAIQILADRYIAWIYWMAVVMISMSGTMAADVLHVGLGVPYAGSTAIFAAVLTAVLLLWHRSEGTLSVDGIRSPRREAFHWVAVLATFALGTACGDMAATVLGLGYLGSGLGFAALMAVPVVAVRNLGMPGTPAFWLACILSRPLGASFAGWMGVDHARGGLDWGTGPVSLVLAILVALIVGYLAFAQPDVERADVDAPNRR